MAQNVVTAGGNVQRGPAAFVQFGQSRRRSAFQACWGVFFAPLPDDALGFFSLTLQNVVIGSSIQIETQDGSSTLYNGVAASSSPTVNLSAYAPGSLFNALRIKVRKGTSSPYYQPYETLTTAFVGSQSIYVLQIPDE